MYTLRNLIVAMVTLIGFGGLVAQAQTVCPSGRDLTDKMIYAINNQIDRSQVVGFQRSMDEQNAYLVIYWQRANYKIIEDKTLLSYLLMCEQRGCGLPENLEGTRFQILKDYHDGYLDHKHGRTSYPPREPLGAPYPDDVMLAWAEGVLGCTTSLSPAQPGQVQQVDPKWVGYDAARQAGGETFRRWWVKNYEMRSTKDAFELCNRFGASSAECGLVAEWTYLNSGRNPYVSTGTTNQNTNGVYSDSGNNPYNAGYKGPTGSSGTNPPVKPPRCYDQGDGTEKCFYD